MTVAPIWYLIIAYLLGSWVGYAIGWGRGFRAAGKTLSRRSGDYKDDSDDSQNP